MTRWIPAVACVALVLSAPPVYAQAPAREVRQEGGFPAGRIEGRVLDEQHVPVAGVLVSVIGRTTAAAVTDAQGRYALPELPYGPYVLSAHLRGYYRSKGQTVHLTAARAVLPEIRLERPAGTEVDSSPMASVPDVPPDAPVTQLAGFGLQPSEPETATGAADPGFSPAIPENESETAWRLRHLPRSILKEVDAEAAWIDEAEVRDRYRWFGAMSAATVPVALFSELPLSGQVNLMTIESFNRPGEIFTTNGPRSVAYVAVNTQAAGGAWAVQGAMTQGDLSSWIVAGSYTSIDSATHAYELGMSYSTQRYDGGNAAALGAIRDSARNVGSVYGHDEWTLSPRLILGYGASYARYDYLAGNGVWSPKVSVTVPMAGVRLKALASRRGSVPGAEEFAPSVTGLWLPPERTFSSLAPDGQFAIEYTRHLQLSMERDLAAGVAVAVRAFDQRVHDQLVEIFDGAPGSAQMPLGHYYVASAGDLDARGWSVAMTQQVPGYLRGTVEYTVATAVWDSSADRALAHVVRTRAPGARERVHDLTTAVEATIPQTATRVYVKYRVNTAFWSDEPSALQNTSANGRFNVRVNQSLPFLRFSSADWEALVDVRNMFRDAEIDSSIYDEAFAIRAPKRIVGGLLVKF